MDVAAAADELAQFWQLPFEFVDLTPERERATLAVVCDDGAVHLPADARAPAEIEAGGPPPEEEEPAGRRWAYAIAAHLPGREQVVASAPWADAPSRAFLRAHAERGSAWLLRWEARAGRAPQLLRLRGPEPVAPRRVAEGRTALLVDLGMVLARFDRALFARNFLTVFGQPAPAAGLRRIQELRPALESGELLADEFLERALDPLNLVAPDKSLLARVWGSILSLKPSTVALVRRAAARPDTAVVVVSNTDPICIRSMKEELGLGDLLANLAASCQDGVNPKGADASLWLRARDLARLRLGGEPDLVIAVDDVRRYLRQALLSGAAQRAIHYRHCAQFHYELGACGVYLPLARSG
ncbi:MAG: hypothetical protein EYC70_14805 [Planctomycetota bacterium]|nr:MAG: hypothetical protein EYC70_14805 [Planctomycetota bacterium]